MKPPARPSFYRFTGTPANQVGRIQKLAVAGPRLKEGYLQEHSPKPMGRPRSNLTRGLKWVRMLFRADRTICVRVEISLRPCDVRVGAVRRAARWITGRRLVR